MKKVIFILSAIMTFTACNNAKKATSESEKGAIFLTDFDTPFGVPPFDKITTDDYEPAFEAGMKQQSEEVDSIANNPEAPTFENTVVALDNSGAILSRVSSVFFRIARHRQQR